MATVPDGKRAGRGFKALRERYVRRAEFLESQQAYWVAVKKAREDWNQKYAEWPIIIKDHPFLESPESLDRRIFHDARQDIEYTSEHGDYNFDRDYRPLDALAAWQKMVAQLTEKFWPPQDFPNPYTDTSHPATSFVTATLYAEQWSLRDWLRLSENIRELVADFPDLQALAAVGDFDVFFRDFRLSPEPLKRLKTTPIDAYVPLDQQAFYLPIFPGMTANDIRQAAPAIAEWIENRFTGRMPEDRMVELAADGLTQQAIADQLGVDRKTVGDVLRRVTFRPKPNIT